MPLALIQEEGHVVPVGTRMLELIDGLLFQLDDWVGEGTSGGVRKLVAGRWSKKGLAAATRLDEVKIVRAAEKEPWSK